MPWLAAGAAGAQEILKDGLDRCLDCHDSESCKGDLDLESMLAADLGQQIDRWERVVSKLQSRQMPPAKIAPMKRATVPCSRP